MSERSLIPREVAAMTPRQAARFWRTRLDSDACGDDDRAAFAQWMAADPGHEAAMEAYDATLDELETAGGAPELAALRAAARADFAQAGAPRRRPWVAGAAALAATLVVAVAAAFAVAQFGFDRHPGEYQTGVGERSAVTLADGSTVTLNTSSRLAVNFTGPERAVTLLEGQALFEVAKDPDRPFVVTAGERRITALGTAFDVRLEADEVRVTLVEGRVAVTPVAVKAAEAPETAPPEPIAAPAPSDPPAPVTELIPGEQLIASADVDAVREADVARVTSWRDGWLVFEEERLADAVSEVNRYSATQLVIEDEALKNELVSGVFRTGETTGFVSAVTYRFDVRAKRTNWRTIALAAKGEG